MWVRNSLGEVPRYASQTVCNCSIPSGSSLELNASGIPSVKNSTESPGSTVIVEVSYVTDGSNKPGGIP